MMKPLGDESKTLRINPDQPESERIREAARIIKDGGLVIFPTDTVYGLGTNAFNPVAVERLFRVKERSRDKPISILIGSLAELEPLVEEVLPQALNLMSRFWPGPLTLIFRATEKVPTILTANSGWIGIRIPDNKITLALIEAVDCPITGPSANLSGGREPLTASEVEAELCNRIDLLIDGGRCKLGRPSTVLDATSLKIIREGAISKDRIEEVLGRKVD